MRVMGSESRPHSARLLEELCLSSTLLSPEGPRAQEADERLDLPAGEQGQKEGCTLVVRRP